MIKHKYLLLIIAALFSLVVSCEPNITEITINNTQCEPEIIRVNHTTERIIVREVPKECPKSNKTEVNTSSGYVLNLIRQIKRYENREEINFTVVNCKEQLDHCNVSLKKLEANCT